MTNFSVNEGHSNANVLELKRPYFYWFAWFDLPSIKILGNSANGLIKYSTTTALEETLLATADVQHPRTAQSYVYNFCNDC